MSHAEKCPICCGKGIIHHDERYPLAMSGALKKTCHGCGGKGWVTVEDDTEPVSCTFVTN